MMDTRGVRCLPCKNLDLKEYPHHAKLGYGKCLAINVTVIFTRVDQSRNCTAFVPAEAGTVEARDEWYEKNPLPAWQR